jgi:hypothetical protein
MTSIAAVVVVIGDEPYEACLASLRYLDEIGLLTDEPRVVESVRRFGAAARLIARPRCIEEIGTELLSATTADWLLLIDPDEQLVCADPAGLRSILRNASADVAGYSISYHFRFLGHLLHRTYEGLRKTKLIRPSHMQWPATIHSLPVPTSAHGQLLDLPDSVASIETELVADVRSRLARHTQWASIEVMEAAHQSVDARQIVQSLIRPIDEYFSKRSCDSDGVAGVLNGLLHLNKSIVALLFQAAVHGVAEEGSQTVRTLGDVLRQIAGVLKEEREEIR